MAITVSELIHEIKNVSRHKGSHKPANTASALTRNVLPQS